MPRLIKVGDVLFRFLPEYQVWHTGIVVSVEMQHIDKVHILEFDDTNNITLVTLRNYMWFRKYFWVAKFKEERKYFGKGVFRTMTERVNTAYQLHIDNSLTYTIYKYNCEYFVRRCVFNDPNLWESNQTMIIARSRLALYTKIASIMLFNIMYKLSDDLEYEKDKKPDEHQYKCTKNGKIKLMSTCGK